ncbi:MAG TPA: carbohydrate kinase [Actinocrinis sp.]|nr:carbohydrate kinase [Actinocrinis sp.]
MNGVFAVLGESLMDLLVTPRGTVTARPGGSPLNVAVGLGRLGAPVSLLTRYGDDAHGRALAEHLAGSGVRVVGDPCDAFATSTATAYPDTPGEGTHYEFDLQWSLAPEVDLPPGTTCLHTGSLATCLEPGAADVRRLIRAWRGRATVSYDPNCRPALMGQPQVARGRVEELVGLADLVKVSAEDLDWLGYGLDYRQVAERWLSLGASLVVVTMGAEGACALSRAGETSCAGRKVDVVDTVGAGDAFTAGLLFALHRRGALAPSSLEGLSGGQFAAVIDEAASNAADTCTRVGADPPWGRGRPEE